MRLLSFLLLLIAASPLNSTARELLREVVHPKSDLPAFHCLLPEDWRHEIDQVGNLQLTNERRTAHFSLSFVHSSDPANSLDELARMVLPPASTPPWDSHEPVEISGHHGFRYTAKVKHSSGVMVRTEILLVAVDREHIASCSMLLSERISQDDEVTARLVLSAIRLLATP